MTKYKQKDALVKDIQDERRRLEKAVSTVPEEKRNLPGVVGEWSVKDVLAHLVEWEQLFLDWYGSGLTGDLPTVDPLEMSRALIDQLNKGFYDRNRLRPLSDVLADFNASYIEILHTVQAIPEADMFTAGRYAWTGKYLLADFIAANTCSHYYWARGKISLHFKS